MDSTDGWFVFALDNDCDADIARHLNIASLHSNLDVRHAGFPTGLETCPSGTLNSANCATYGCSTVNIPAYPGQAASPSMAPSGLSVICLLILPGSSD